MNYQDFFSLTTARVCKIYIFVFFFLGKPADLYNESHPDCGLLNNLLPSDLVLADRGFNIEESVGLYAASLQIPSFTKGKPQLSALDIETTRSLANGKDSCREGYWGCSSEVHYSWTQRRPNPVFNVRGR